MITIEESLHWYALGKKGHTHSKKVGRKGRFLYENLNVTYTQDFLGDYHKWRKGDRDESI